MQLRKVVVVGLITGFGWLSSCQKDVVEQKEATNPVVDSVAPPLAGTQLKDSTLFYTKDIYLWYNQIPASFNPQVYEDPNAIMTAVRAYSSEPGYPAAVDRWSFAMKKTEWDNLSMGISSTTEENEHDFGMNVFFRVEGDLRVRYVESASPAGLAGIRRGWRITKINGSTNVTTSNSTTVSNAVYQSTNSSFTFQKPDGTSVDITLKAGSYKENPVVLDSVYAEGDKKVGYLVFNSFLGDTTQIYNNLQRVFNRFSQEQVNELVIDLRYNGGGYVTVQEKLANYLVHASFNRQIMMKEQFNNKHTNFNSTTTFSKAGTVSVNRISFIVSSLTASASELLINNLKPYMDVRVVGPSKTHGKPVGFFPIPVGEWYIFPVSFRTVNKNGESNYFNGLSLTNQVADGIDKDWGDRNEAALGFILSGLRNGTYRTGASEAGIDASMQDVNERLSGNKFQGTVDTRRMF